MVTVVSLQLRVRDDRLRRFRRSRWRCRARGGVCRVKDLDNEEERAVSSSSGFDDCSSPASLELGTGEPETHLINSMSSFLPSSHLTSFSVLQIVSSNKTARTTS